MFYIVNYQSWQSVLNFKFSANDMRPVRYPAFSFFGISNTGTLWIFGRVVFPVIIFLLKFE